MQERIQARQNQRIERQEVNSQRPIWSFVQGAIQREYGRVANCSKSSHIAILSVKMLGFHGTPEGRHQVRRRERIAHLGETEERSAKQD